LWLQLKWPIPGRIALSGSFGEMRTYTMHMGIDIPTGERIGEVPVLAAGEGYVFRIRVSHGGFGKVVYVRHPQGLITVYGHLSHFAPKGEAIVEALQQAQKRFEVEKFLGPEEWRVRAGDTLGWAGNSGYSFGPHLHFEVRTLRDEPLSPLKYLPALRDTEPPVFFRVGLSPLSRDAHIQGRSERTFFPLRQVSRSSQKRIYICPETIRVSGKVGFLYTAADRSGGGTAWLGLRQLALIGPSGALLYKAQWETLDFDWRRFLKWHVDYAYQQVYRIGVGRLYDPSVPFPWSSGSGVIEVPPGVMTTYILQAEDYAGNQAEVRITLSGDSASTSIRYYPLHPRRLWDIEEGLLRVRSVFFTSQKDTISPTKPLWLGGRLVDTLFSPDGKAFPTYVRACVPPGVPYELPLTAACTLRIFSETLQDTLYLRVEPDKSIFGEGLLIGDPYIPLRFPAELIWRIPENVRIEKSYPLFRPWYEEVWSPVRGAQRVGRVWRIPVRSWGAYVVMEDNTPPQIRPLKPAGPFYLVSIEDLGSGVNPYSFRISSEKGVVYPEYYEPQRILYLPRRKGRRFTIEVSDYVRNQTRTQLSFQ
ncbi:MAG: M23 family metallopeptidase, partial [Bacteroidia bacterium]|nr:M23 family metallopeptidase [Bacteroidia bacterium]